MKSSFPICSTVHEFPISTIIQKKDYRILIYKKIHVIIHYHHHHHHYYQHSHSGRKTEELGSSCPEKSATGKKKKYI